MPFGMNQTQTVGLAVFVALGLTLVAGLIAIPTIEKAQASLDIRDAIRGRIQFHNELINQILGGIGGCDGIC
jgi:hypothetical protein